MAPIEEFFEIISKFMVIPLKLVGANIINPQFKRNAVTILGLLVAFLFIPFALATCTNSVLEECSQSVILSLIGVQVPIRVLFKTKQNIDNLFQAIPF